MIKRTAIVSFICVAGALVAQAITPLWLRDVKISPNGKEIAFTYQGDIYKVPVKGGAAVRLTASPAYDQMPLWSPDGKYIAFASDREGSSDIYIMSSSGGVATRLTSYSGNEVPETFTPDGKYVMFSAMIQDPVKSAVFPSARMTELYQVPVSGGRITQVIATPAQMVSWSPDGKSFVYQDHKGVENEWRKHHTSSVTRDLWLYTPATNTHVNITAHAGEDRNPVISPDGTSLLFLSERNGGSMNVYEMPLSSPGAQPKALTSFKEHPVRFLSQATDGTIALTWDGEIYTLQKGGKPQKVAIDLITDSYNTVEYLAVNSGASGGVPSPDGTMVAFTKRGEVFVTSVEYATTKQITNTAAAEKNISWGSDNRTLYYTSERDGKLNIYKATMSRKEDSNFANATVINEEALMSTTDAIDRGAAQVSPDGKKLAFVANRSALMVMDLDSKKVSELVPASLNAHRNGVDYSWSPDSKWIAFTMVDNGHDPYYNIGVVNVDGKPEISTITSSGYFDMEPKWNAAGDAVIFISDRYGMRSHGSWGSLNDVMAVFMNQEAYDKYKLSEEEAKLLKDAEKSADKDKKEASDKKDDKDKEKETDKKTVKIERDGFEYRTVRLTPYSSDISSAEVNADFDKLYYLSKVEKGYDLWKIDLRKGGASIVSKTNDASANLIPDAKRKSLFIMSGKAMKKMDFSGEKIKTITYSGKMRLDRAAEREAMYADMRKQEAEKFYVENMHGVDWKKLTNHYTKFLPHINNNYDFAEMLSEILGELNVSHTGSGYRAPGAHETTGNFGLLYDLDYNGKGLKVAEVVIGGPMANSKSKVVPGCIIEAVNSQIIDDKTDYTQLFNGIVGKKTLVTVYNPTSGERFDEIVNPISQGAMNDLLYKRWVRNRAADVERLSGGRLGYVHIRNMNDESFRTIYAEILGKYYKKEGIVIDTRFNGGGRLHEDIEILFSGEKYFTQEKRGVELCDMPSRRWNKPSIMLQCEANYSNSHGTPWVYKHRKLGKLVGMPVAGTMTSVNWVTLQDPTLYFGIPVIGYRTADGSFLENSQLEPDILVANDAAVVVTGEDQQLKAAVDELLREIDAKKK